MRELRAFLGAYLHMASEHGVGGPVRTIRLREHPYVAYPRMGSQIALKRRAGLHAEPGAVLLLSESFGGRAAAMLIAV